MKWHKVELHTHTIASDGDMLPSDLVDNALDRKYEAIALTDHNTINFFFFPYATASSTEVSMRGNEP